MYYYGCFYYICLKFFYVNVNFFRFGCNNVRCLNLLSALTAMKRRLCPGKGVGALKDHE